MKILKLSLFAAVLCFSGIGCAAKASVKTGQNTGAAAAVHVGYNGKAR